MLIKLSCGYEINPERVTLEVRGIHCFAHIDSLTLPLKSDEEAKIRAYHTKTVVVDGAGMSVAQWIASAPESLLAPDHRHPEANRGHEKIQLHVGPYIKCGEAEGHYGKPCFEKKDPVSKPFTVQDLPKAEPDPEQKRIEDLALKQVHQIKQICRSCTKHGSRPLCEGCFQLVDHKVTMTKFVPKPEYTLDKNLVGDCGYPIVADFPDCSGSQHEKRNCSNCRHGNNRPSQDPCNDCANDVTHTSPHWEPRI